ncbi:MAG: hypothetical protein H6550_02370 [Chitinophagales bacterium]|nr:hypothetical protein [Chitinophagales bacterium]
MKRLLFIFLALLPVLVYGQADIQISTALGQKNMLKIMDSSWRFINADDSTMAMPDYNDSSWAMVNPELKGDSSIEMLKGIGWFRKQVNVTDSVCREPLAMSIRHYGASEIYVDGKLLERFGKISGNPDSTEYYNPIMQPVIFIFHDTGMHTIAIRYANYRTEVPSGHDSYIHGFTVSITEANSAIAMNGMLRMIIIGFMMVLSAIFATLAGLHFLLWLFRYSDKSNLFLSILCVVFCIYFIMQSYWSQSGDADVFIHKKHTTGVLLAIALIVLSALLNYLFSRFGPRFLVIASLCIAAMIMTMNDARHEDVISSAIMAIVMLEAVILIIAAIRNKVKGAKILAIGILPLAICTMLIFIITLLMGNDMEAAAKSGNPGGSLLMAMAFLSILSLIAFSGIPLSMSVFLAWRFARVNKDLSIQLEQVKELSEKTQQQEAEKKRILENQKAQLEQEVAERTSEIIEEKKKSDDLLHNILPQEVASELKERGATTAHHFDHVTVLFTDFVDFTIAGERMGSQALVEELHSCFKAFDNIMGKYGIEKIKTIGDAYMAVCGLPRADEHHAEKVVKAAMEIRAFMQQRYEQLGDKTFEVRIGIHSGEVVAGIVGVKKFAYDIWGDTVNTAARMEQNSEPGKINISETTHELVKHKFTCTYRGELDAKNKGKLKMYFVEA